MSNSAGDIPRFKTLSISEMQDIYDEIAKVREWRYPKALGVSSGVDIAWTMIWIIHDILCGYQE